MRPVFDSHFHYLHIHPLHESAALLEEECRLRDVTRLGILACPSEGTPQDPIQNAQGIGLKKLLFPKAYAFAGLMHNKELSDEEQAKDFVRQAALYYEAGFDGMKMLEGKPFNYRIIGRKLDEEVFDPFYSFCEEKGFPIVMHIADPKEFWDINKIDKYALEHGWFCDESVPAFDAIYDSLFHLLDKHKKLTLILAHFGFFSYEKSRAERFLQYENTYIDTTPAPSEVLAMCRELDFWGPFIKSHADRYIFGTDSYNHICSPIRPTIVRNFFESEPTDIHDYVGKPYCGIGADEELIQKVYGENAYRVLGAEPAPINEEAARKIVEEARPKVAPGSFEEEEINTLAELFK